MIKDLEKVTVLEVKEVAFNNNFILGVKTSDGKIYASIKKFCDDLGLKDHKKQISRIKKDDVLNEGGAVLALPSNGGIQDVFCLDVDFLASWLTSISIKHCAEEIRPLLLEFKKKAAKVLAAAFIASEKKEDPKVLSQIEILLQSVQLLAENEKRLVIQEQKTNDLENKIIKFERIQSEATSKLFEPELPSVLPLQKSDRAKINEIVKNFAIGTGINYSSLWTKLYTEFTARYHIDLVQRAKNQKLRPLDIAETLCKLPELFAVAGELFHPRNIKCFTELEG